MANLNKRRYVRAICAILSFCMLLSLCFSLASCADREDDGKIKIVCTLFPQYDWLRNIIGENDGVELSLIVKNGTDIHSYQPTAADIMEISDCDMIVYLGGGADGWVEQAIERAEGENIKKIALTECDGVTLHNISSSSEGHSHGEHGHKHEDHDHGTTDEHLWLSLNNAMAICHELCAAICELDVEREEDYLENTEKYIEKLSRLDEKYQLTVAEAEEQKRFMLFCDRFPFVYLLEDYGVEYSAAFEGCSADADADFATVLRLIEELNAHGLDSVIACEGSDVALARTVISSSSVEGGRVLVMNSLQAMSEREIAKGVSYLSVMEENLGVMRIALGLSD